MSGVWPRAFVTRFLLNGSAVLGGLCLVYRIASADQVEMQNGDRYVGKVLSVSTNTVTLQSEVLGTVNLPRARVAHIALGTTESVTNTSPAALGLPKAPAALARPGVAGSQSPPTITNGNLSAAFHQLGGKTNFIQEIQSQYLNAAGPEANAKFNEMVAGLMTGKLNVSDIRREAQSAASQLRAAKKDLGSDDTGMVDEYLAILDKFINETGGTPASSATNATPGLKSKQPPQPKQANE